MFLRQLSAGWLETRIDEGTLNLCSYDNTAGESEAKPYAMKEPRVPTITLDTADVRTIVDEGILCSYDNRSIGTGSPDHW